jgi:hypothetical protein
MQEVIGRTERGRLKIFEKRVLMRIFGPQRRSDRRWEKTSY